MAKFNKEGKRIPDSPTGEKVKNYSVKLIPSRKVKLTDMYGGLSAALNSPRLNPPLSNPKKK